jgi:hypothetical protein
MMVAINPVLMSLPLKFEAGLKELKVDLSEIADLKDQILSHDAKIAALQARIRGTPTNS